MGARREGGSGVDARWPEQAVEDRIGHAHTLQPIRRRRPAARDMVRNGWQQRGRDRQVVAEQVERRSRRIVQVERPIIMVVMPFLLPMQGRMRQIRQDVDRRARPRQRH